MDKEIIETLKNEMRAGFSAVTTAIGETNARLDQTNARLDENTASINARIDGLRESVNVRLDGIGNYLMSINGSILRHEERLTNVERRLDRLEDAS